MALVSRICIDKHSLNGLFNRLCKVPKHNHVQIANITRGINRTPRARPPPYPYKEKSMNWLRGTLDFAYARFDDNSRLIVVEGPVAAGKDKFARELAIEFEMGYMPAPSFDLMYKDYEGNDLRSLDHLVPPRMQTCDIQRFLTNPEHVNVINCQLIYYMLKLQAYYESLLHILSTGEGVVMNRCVYSDFVFAKAMYKAGYINRNCFKFYEKVVAASLDALRPHVIIYLDVPVKVVKENIKKRGIPYEVNSKVLTTQYLTDIERIYKEEYLPKLEPHSHILMYDWDSGENVDDVALDIERLEFKFDYAGRTKLIDWTICGTLDLTDKRIKFCRSTRADAIAKAMIFDPEVPEVFLLGEDVDTYNKYCETILPKYEKGFNPDKGDKYLWKVRQEHDHSKFPNVITHKELLASQ